MDAALQFGRYRVLSVLHHGRTGVVYQASFGGSTKMVAVKALDPSVGNDLVLRERFIRGARAMSLVRSPHLASIYEVGVQMPSGHVWCAMELVEGRSLQETLAGERPRPSEALRIARQLGAALSAVHAGGVIHRNVKPANVLLTARPDDERFVRLVGFGLVKLREADGVPDMELTARGAVVGTPAYMAPEALRDSSSVDERADVFSFGCVLYEMLTGHLPWPAGARSAAEQLHARMAGPPPLGVDPTIDELLASLLAPEKHLRPRSMDEALDALALAMLDDELPTRREIPAARNDFLDCDSADPTAPGKPPRS